MNRIRITGGSFKGRSIAIAKGSTARYTSGKIREAIFNLVGDVNGAEVLDLFAGAGSFTVEALSREAARVVSVEKDTRTAAVLAGNLKTMGVDKDCLVLNMDVRYAVPMLLRQKREFDFIFADPPYEMGYVAVILGLLAHNPIWHENSLVLFEHSKRESIGSVPPQFDEVRTYTYGDTYLSMMRCAPGIRAGT
jgi:16S rRNA (guanine966-N2)-methyltransferase